MEQPGRHQRDGPSRKTSASRTCRPPVAELGYVCARPVVDATHADRLTQGSVNYREGGPRRIPVDLQERQLSSMRSMTEIASAAEAGAGPL